MLAPFRRLLGAMALLLTAVLAGGLGYWLIGHGRWGYSECVYMTTITLTTVGFGELPNMAEVAGARLLTGFIAAFGVGVVAYAQGNVTALVIEGAFGEALRRRRMQKAIEALRGHVVIAGAGSTGRHVVEELHSTATAFVVIDLNEAHMKRISEDLCEGQMLYVLGDATDDHALIAAGVRVASGVVAALTDDRDNVFVTLSARSLNPNARIVSKVIEDPSEAKMLKAGATAVVSPTQIGGRRIASELLRPNVNEFFDQMFRDTRKLRLEEVAIPSGSTYDGQALRDTPIRKETSLLVIAVKTNDGAFVYNPDPHLVLTGGSTLIVMGEVASVVKLRKLVAEAS
ncbi:MAG: potassium channel protein [Myxococcales bacterium]|nr:potassium channel protein [Myxococcales bacterium]HQY65486.1 potassium channel protein [Polyangiaceae bacterium]